MASNLDDQPQPVASILDKFTKIHRGIEQAREETSKVRIAINEGRRNINRLQQERGSMEASTEREKTERLRIVEATEQVLSKIESLQRDKAELTSDVASSKRKLELTKQVASDYRQAFIQESREFQVSCKRLCTRASLLRMDPKTPLHAYAFSKQHEEEGGGKEKAYQDIILDYERCNQEIEDKDEALTIAMRKNEDAQALFSEADKAREELLSKKSSLKAKASIRETHKSQLQSQLLRIQKEVQELQVNIAKIEEETLQLRVMGANLKKGKSMGASWVTISASWFLT